ncbi:MAG TPA: RIP metalloprotease RseP [bacterium]|nr:RIP metalloprotease RseP [bacterium]HPN42283.1 RIP metalloprotease RseP [bacterium]
METVIHFLTTYLIPFVFVLGLLVIVHEFGHFILAKLMGIRVERFSIGFPPRLFGKKIGDTDYCLSALPLGGYVKMSGMIDESMDKDSIKGEPWEFMSKPIWKRVLVIFAGPAFNILLAIAIFFTSIYISGVAEPVTPSLPVVGSVIKDKPAEKLGLLEGDVIKSINSQPVQTWEDLVNIIHVTPEKELFLEWERNGEVMTGTVIPELDPINNIGLIGVGPVTQIRKPGVFEAMGMGCTMTWNLTKMMGESFSLMFKGKIAFKESIGGPIQIAKLTGERAADGFGSLMWFAAFLSLNLGLLNLLPIPVLDGGHLVFLAIEAVIRRPLSVKLKMIVQQVGMALLLALMLFVIVNDFSRLGN